MTAIQILSDLHLVDTMEIEKLSPSGDICVVAGDVCEIDSQKELFILFLEWCSENFNQTIFVPGNHEYYSSVNNIQETEIILQDTIQKFDNIVYLQKDIYIYNNIRFIGCTLWSDIKRSVKVFTTLKDFKKIPNFNFNDYLKLFSECKDFIEEIDNLDDKINIIVTHHLPSYNCITEKYRHLGDINTCFASNLTHYLSKADVWIFGHSHNSFDEIINNCRCISNPKGYGNENKSYEPKKIIYI